MKTNALATSMVFSVPVDASHSNGGFGVTFESPIMGTSKNSYTQPDQSDPSIFYQMSMAIAMFCASWTSALEAANDAQTTRNRAGTEYRSLLPLNVVFV